MFRLFLKKPVQKHDIHNHASRPKPKSSRAVTAIKPTGSLILREFAAKRHNQYMENMRILRASILTQVHLDTTLSTLYFLKHHTKVSKVTTVQQEVPTNNDQVSSSINPLIN